MNLDSQFIADIKEIWLSSRIKAFTLVNRALIEANWSIGRRIVQEEQKGSDKAEYGSQLLKEIAKRLSDQLDKSLDERELRRMRRFYLYFPDPKDIRPELTWTHFRLIIKVEDPAARFYYLKEAAEQSWGTRQLERNIQSFYYQRILSTHPDDLLNQQTKKEQISAEDLVKDPYVLEFLGMDIPAGYSETDLESAIINKLQHFLLEMGKGFAFVGRQVIIKTETKQFYIDLVFYNFLLKNFILIDLKINELTHQDIGQMDMYVRIFDHLKKVPGDNPTVGLILCSEKDETIVKYSVLEENKQLFASRYRLVLPTEDQLSAEIQSIKEKYRLKDH